MMNLPSAATIVCVNESLKVMYKPKNGHSFWSYLLCASLAGLIIYFLKIYAILGSSAAFITIPLDVVKTKL